MSSAAVQNIEGWFDNPANEEGDFFRSRHVSWLISPEEKSDRIIYCTKHHVIERIFHDADEIPDAGVICRAGLPQHGDAAWIRSFVGDRQVLFVGDMDPADIMIFEWLRTKLSIARIIYAGLNDRLARRLNYQMPLEHQIPLRAPEQLAISRIEEFVPDVRMLLGPTGFGIWDAGFKIELEALLIDASNRANFCRALTED